MSDREQSQTTSSSASHARQMHASLHGASPKGSAAMIQQERDRLVSEALDHSPEGRAKRHARALRAFYAHLATYISIITFLFIIDLITGEGWWFFWPALGWGIAIAMNAFALLGGRLIGDDWEEKKAKEYLERDLKRTAPPSPRSVVNPLIKRGRQDVADLRANADRFTKPEVREQAARICKRADQILIVLQEPERDERLAHEFVHQVLEPARTVFSTYALLNERGITSAQMALKNVEIHDLPVIERTLDDLHERLHREDVISLEVASEMLALSNPRSENP